MELEKKPIIFQTLTSDSFISKFCEFRTKEEYSFLKTKFNSRSYSFRFISEDIFLLGFCMGVESYYREHRSLKNIDSFFGRFLKDIGPDYLDFKYADHICSRLLGSTFNYAFVQQVEEELRIFENCDLEGFYERFGESMQFKLRSLMSVLMRICCVSITFNINVSKESQNLTANTVDELIRSSKSIFNYISYEERKWNENFLNLIMNVICEFFSISVKQYTIRNNGTDFSQIFPEKFTPGGHLSQFKVAFVLSYNVNDYFLISKTESIINPQPLNCYECKQKMINTEHAVPLKYSEFSLSQEKIYVNPYICKICAINKYCSLDMNKLVAPYFENSPCYHKFCLNCLQVRLTKIFEANIAENEKKKAFFIKEMDPQDRNLSTFSCMNVPLENNSIDLSQPKSEMKCFVKNCNACISLTELNTFLEQNKITNPEKHCEMCMGVLKEMMIKNKKKGAKFFQCYSCKLVLCGTHKKVACKCYCLCEYCSSALKDEFILDELSGEIYQYFECETCKITTCSECKERVKGVLGPCKCKCISCANKILLRSEIKIKKCPDCLNVCDECFLILDYEKVNYCEVCERNTCRTCINTILREDKEDKDNIKRCGHCFWKDKGKNKPFLAKLANIF